MLRILEPHETIASAVTSLRKLKSDKDLVSFAKANLADVVRTNQEYVFEMLLFFVGKPCMYSSKKSQTFHAILIR